MTLLRLGSEGVDVIAWQTFLNGQGFDVGQIDGSFGPLTKTATVAFQFAHVLGGGGNGEDATPLEMLGGSVRSSDGPMTNTSSIVATKASATATGMVDLETLNEAIVGWGFLRNLQRGSHGAYVMAWQTFLHTLTPFDTGRPDGIFGPTTQAATKAFQMTFLGTTMTTGVVNTATLQQAQTQGFLTWILELGSRGQDVVSWQTFLNQQKPSQLGGDGLNCGRVDGIFGPSTKAATRMFQQIYQLQPVDGVVGPTTLAKAQSMGFVIPAVAEEVPAPIRPLSSPSSSSFPPKGTFNVVLDISHYQTRVDFERIKRSGIQAVIAKSTEGYGYTDPTYHARRKQALAAGLLWGAYHFGTGTAVPLQLDYFFSVVLPTKPDPQEDNVLLVLDWEENPSGTQMSLIQARDFVQGVYDRTHRWPVLYGGKLLRDTMQRTGGDVILNKCPLWIAEYGTKSGSGPQIPVGWSQYTLWQYTNGIAGPHPRYVDGVEPENCCDRSVFQPTLSSSSSVRSSSTSTTALAHLDDFWKSGLA